MSVDRHFGLRHLVRLDCPVRYLCDCSVDSSVERQLQRIHPISRNSVWWVIAGGTTHWRSNADFNFVQIFLYPFRSCRRGTITVFVFHSNFIVRRISEMKCKNKNNLKTWNYQLRLITFFNNVVDYPNNIFDIITHYTPIRFHLLYRSLVDMLRDFRRIKIKLSNIYGASL